MTDGIYHSLTPHTPPPAAKCAPPPAAPCAGRNCSNSRGGLIRKSDDRWWTASGYSVPQWIGIASRGASSWHASAARFGVHVAGPQGRSPAPHGQQRQVERTCIVGHGRKHVGVAGKIDAGMPVHDARRRR